MSIEPVAYINVAERALEWAKPIKWHTPTVVNLEPVPLYTQREWVGLTDEEFHDLQVDPLDDPWTNFKIVEEALKEKNT